MQTPSGYAMNGSQGGGDNNDQGDNTCTHATTELKNKTEATCTANGYTGDTHCKSCGVKLSSGTTVNAKGHQWSEWTLNADGTEKTRTCSNCKTTEAEAVEKCSHSYTVLKNKLAANCGSDGYTGDICCAKCGVFITPGEVIPKSGEHVYGEFEIILQPGDTPGLQQCKCEICGHVKTEMISNYTTEEKIVAEISWNAVFALLNSYLTKA